MAAQPASTGPAATGPAATDPEFEVDPQWEADDDKADSTFGDETSSTTSISASILNYRKIHGRTYQNFNTGPEYWGPNDEQQNENIDLVHHMLYLALDNKLFQAPIGDNPHQVLDIGTGTGIWAIDFADEFPSAHVIGTDLSPIQPSWVPANCSFELDDAQQAWTYPDDHFDFIHIRALLGSIKDWNFLYSEVFRCLKPGGWFEHLDFSMDVHSNGEPFPEDHVWHTWASLFHQAGDKLGQTFKIVEDGKYLQWFKDAGFKSIDSRPVRLPLGGWPAEPKLKEVGQFNQLICEQGLEGYALYVLTNVHGWEYTEVQALLGKVRQALRDKTQHAYYKAGVAWGQKPVVTIASSPESDGN